MIVAGAVFLVFEEYLIDVIETVLLRVRFKNCLTVSTLSSVGFSTPR